MNAPHHHAVDDHALDDHDRGLSFDLDTLLDRRRALRLLGIGGAGLGIVALTGCGSDTTASNPSTSSTSSTTTETTSCAVIPEETAGPYPGDGSNGVDVLSQTGVVRSDITTSFGTSSGVAAGIPTEVVLTVRDAANRCAPLAGAAVYLWHADADGRYSMYSEGVVDQNYLRGVQAADANGQVRFSTIFPGCYDGRWPHMHFEVYPSVDAATSAASLLATSQLALPEATAAEVYADTSIYPSSTRNLASTSLTRDMVFSDDGAGQQMAAITGNSTDGYTASLDVTV